MGLLPSAPLAAQAETVATKVAVVGASASAGFVDFVTGGAGAKERNETVRLSVALEGIWPDAEIINRSDAVMFMDPDTKGERQIERIRRMAPDLLLGVDFLTWFAYGPVPPGRDEIPGRLERLRRGFALLDRIEAPIVVGDFPDMREADPRMMPPRFVPSPEALVALNEALATWAGERPRVVVFPLDAWVRKVKRGEDRVQLHGREVLLPEERLLQTDRLHPTRLGIALMAYRLLPSCRAVLPAGHALLEDLPNLETVIELAGADVDLPEPVGAEAGRR